MLGARTVPDPAEALRFFRAIAEQADHMRGLIGDLLDHGRIVTALSVSPEPTGVAALVRRARSTFLGGGGRVLDIDLPEDLPRVMADPARIVQALGNLLSNAARHSPSRPPSASPPCARAFTWRFRWPTGTAAWPPGCRAPVPQARRGGRRRGDAGGRPRPDHLRKGLVEAHGGRIQAESGGPGRGARFTCTVPVAWEAACGAGPEPPARRPPRKAAWEKTRIVVDDPQTLRYVRDALTRAGCEAIVTGDCGSWPTS